jgi:hypothetical protein
MTPLMMLALTVPPSIAFVLERWMRGREVMEQTFTKIQGERITQVAELGRDNNIAIGVQIDKMRAAEAELKRLAEQVSLLADRYR